MFFSVGASMSQASGVFPSAGPSDPTFLATRSRGWPPPVEVAPDSALPGQRRRSGELPPQIMDPRHLLHASSGLLRSPASHHRGWPPPVEVEPNPALPGQRCRSDELRIPQIMRTCSLRSSHREGAANKQGECATCHGSFTVCPGHFGYLKLALPVFNVGFFNNILGVLKCICKGCSRVLLVEKDRREFLKKMRNPRAGALLQKSAIMKKVRDKCKPSRCPWCGYINGVAKKGKAGLVIVHDRSKTLDGSTEELRSALSHKKEKLSIPSVHMLDPATVLSLFRRMTDEDCELLNLGDRPEKLIITEIAVPPVPIRPSVFVGGDRKRIAGKSFNLMLLNISTVMLPLLLSQKIMAWFSDLKGRQADFVGTCLENVPSTLEGLSYLLTRI